MFLLPLCASFVYSVYACSRTYGAFSRELRRGTARVVRYTTRSAATAAAAAAAASSSTYCRLRRRCCCCCCLLSWTFESRSPGGGKQSLRNKMGQPVEQDRVLSSGPIELGFESTWGRVLVFFFFLRLFFTYTKTQTFFSFQ